MRTTQILNKKAFPNPESHSSDCISTTYLDSPTSADSARIVPPALDCSLQVPVIKGPVGCFSDFLFASKCYPVPTLALAHTFQPMASFTCTTHEPATLVLHIKGRVVKAAPPRSRTQGQDQMALSKAPVAEFTP